MPTHRELRKEFPMKNKNPNGGVAQLGEHLPCKQGVMGSNPIISTKGKTMCNIATLLSEKNYTEYGLIAQLVRAPA